MTRAWRNTVAPQPPAYLRYAALRGTAERRLHRRSRVAQAWWLRAIRGDDAAIAQAYAYDKLTREAARLVGRLSQHRIEEQTR